MHVSFDTEETDLKVSMSYANSALYKSLSPRIALLVNTLVWACVAIVLLSLADAYHDAQAWPVAVGIAGGSGIVVVVGYLSYRQKRIMQACLDHYRPFPIHQIVSLSDAGVELESRSVSALYPWTSVRSVHSTSQHIVIILRPLSALAIPHSAFDDIDSSKAFYSRLSSAVAS
jgi:hypothetical protein